MIKNITEDTIVISDTHFGHKNILSFEPPRTTKMRIDGFEDPDEWLIELWNSQVKETDTVLFLGDFAFKNIQNYTKILNGKIYMILGNHDRKGEQPYKNFEGVFKSLWIKYNSHELIMKNEIDELFSGLIMDFGDKTVMFSHYPVFDNNEWDLKNERIQKRVKILEEFYDNFSCDLNVHGHTHSKKSNFKNSYNSSIENSNFKFKTIGQILEEKGLKWK